MPSKHCNYTVLVGKIRIGMCNYRMPEIWHIFIDMNIWSNIVHVFYLILNYQNISKFLLIYLYFNAMKTFYYSNNSKMYIETCIRMLIFKFIILQKKLVVFLVIF